MLRTPVKRKAGGSPIPVGICSRSGQSAGARYGGIAAVSMP